ncbi:MAG: hypothetical protein A2161_13220 [Candidatus Schekmanbacteria bacterium RBG_13_48_7]|uniref:HTH arsR-type domain-containing protein n=1 Tax=Candidatus Schekmanbacteria bacterium RBG_13_48_7 TaxID=1817878 RepID=A0A1F7RQB8_9BACT|nr:MAG: hypothetical protein A2161_13220 [Candidatus Schekmanbacteria bacterium RBG_13_48_7]
MTQDTEKIFKALSDKNRLRILKMLEVRPLCGCELSHVLNIVHSAISRRLKILTEAGLITRNRDGSFILYSLNVGTNSPVASCQLGILRGWMNDDFQIIDDRKKLLTINRHQFSSAHSRSAN